MDRKALSLALATLIILVATTSGCINVYLAKDAVNPDQGEIVYRVNDKIVMKHFFETVVSDASSTENHTTNTTDIVAGTEWMRVTIDVTLDDISIIPIPAGLPIDFERYVHFIITTPDGLTWFDKIYNITERENLEILGPMEGTWIFQINAVGYGSDLVSFHDGYKVFVSVNEPVVLK